MLCLRVYTFSIEVFFVILQEQFVDRGAALDYGRYCFHNCVPTVMINGFLVEGTTLFGCVFQPPFFGAPSEWFQNDTYVYLYTSTLGA